jgi:hypothetical protein
MVDWLFVWKIFFTAVIGTFIASAILTLIIKLTSIYFTNYHPHDEDLED